MYLQIPAFFLLLGLPVLQEEKATPPDSATQDRVLKEIRELLKDDYARRDPEGRKNLALRLLEEAGKAQGDPATHYVLLTEAAALAAEAGDVGTSLSALRRLGAQFNSGDISKLKLEALSTASRSARTAGQVRTLAAGYLDVAREAAAEGAFDEAQDAVKKASSLARRARDRGLSARSAAFGKVVPELKREHAAFAKTDLTKAIDIGNTKTNLDIGRVLLFVKGDEGKGLEYLQYSGRGSLSDLAAKELAGANDAASKVALGEGWWSLSRKERNALHKRRYGNRARLWFERADLEATGLDRMKISKRLGEIEDALPGGPVNLLRLVRPAEHGAQGTWTLEGGALRCGQAEGAARVLIPYAPPDEYDLEAVVERINSHDGIIFGLASGGRSWLLRIDSHPAKGYLTGVEMLDGKFQDQHSENATGRRIENGRSYAVAVSVRNGRVTLAIDGAEIYSWKGEFQRLGPSSLWPMKDARALFVGGWGGGVAFKELRLKPVSGAGNKLK